MFRDHIELKTLIICRSERAEDGKSMKNPQHGVLSKAYSEFPDPLSKGRDGGFDVHIYHFQVSDWQVPLPGPKAKRQ